MSTGDKRQLMVLTLEGGRHLAMAQDPEYAFLLVHDVERDHYLGPVPGDCGMFFLRIDGKRCAVFAGTDEEDRPAHLVNVEFPPERAIVRVLNGVWMTFPMPLVDGSPLTVTWHDQAGCELRRYEEPAVFPQMLAKDISDFTFYAPSGD